MASLQSAFSDCSVYCHFYESLVGTYYDIFYFILSELFVFMLETAVHYQRGPKFNSLGSKSDVQRILKLKLYQTSLYFFNKNK